MLGIQAATGSSIQQNARHVANEIFEVRWSPRRDTAVAAASYLAVVAGLVLAFQIITTAHVAANFITFGPVTLAGLGVALPLLYTVLARRRPIADLGITRRHVVISGALGLLLGIDTYRNTLATVELPALRLLVPLVAMSLTVGLFEAVFFRGWLQSRFESAFGLIPGVVLARSPIASTTLGTA